MRSGFLGAILAALALLAASSNGVAQMMAAAPPAPPVPLTVCVFKAADDPDTAKLLDRFQDAATGFGFYRNMVTASSIADAQDCDVSIKLACDHDGGHRTGRAEVFSTRSQRPLFHAERKQGWGWGFAEVLAREVHARFVNDPGLVQLAAARDNAARVAQQTATEAPSKPDSALAPNFAAAEHPDDLAVIVGIESYSGIDSKALYAENDAESFKAYVRALGVPERNIVLLTGSKAVRSALTKNLEGWLPRMAKPDSRVYFYFSGHGAPDVATGTAYLVPWDGDPNYLAATAYPVAQLYHELGALPVKQVLVAMDSCFSGAGGRSVLASGARPLVSKIKTGALPANVTVLAASASNEISGSIDAQRHGAFTYFLLEGLNAGQKTPRELIRYLTPRVQDESRRLNRDQTPQLLGDGDWALR